MHRLVTFVAALVVLLLAPPTIGAQEAEPLQKSDIIRLLTGTTYTKAEVAGIIRQSCLSFAPTARDRTDFRALGADEAVMTAIEGCAAVPPPVAAPALQFSMSRRIFDVSAGDTVQIPVTVNRGATGESGLRLQLVGSGALVEGSDARAVTDENGRGAFVFPVGNRAGTFNLTLAGNVTVGGSRAVTLRVAPGAPVRVAISPDPLALVDEDTPGLLRVVVQDRFGNAVADVPLEMRAGSESGTALASGRTSAEGALEFEVVASLLGGDNRLVFMSGGQVLGSSGVARPAAAVARLVAISGDDQAADANSVLPLPLVVAVMDVAGAPTRNVEVRFSADNGRVSPEMALTDDGGQASTMVTMGARGAETTVTAVAGEVSRVFAFPITVGGMTVAAMQAALVQAAVLIEAGDAAGARELYSQVVEADPSNLAAATGVADTYAAEGQYAEAVERYRAVLRMEPSRRDAQVGMARASLGAGDNGEAARWFDLALTQNRTDVDSWVGLGTARARLGQESGAREAYERALDLDPANEEALRGLDRLSQNPLLFEADLWGGYTNDNGRDPGFRWAEVRLAPGAGFEFWLAFDNMLSFRHPYLVRGQDDIEGMYGGLGYSYGANRASRTSFEFGRRKEPVNGTIQTTWTLDQTFGFESGGWFKLGGWLGHWFDRDDWVLFAEGGISAGSSTVVKPSISYGDYFGSGLSGVPEGVPNRVPSKEFRVGLATRFEAESGLGVEPAVFYGNVSNDISDELSGSLWDASMRLWYAFSQTFAIDSFVEYQTPPGLPSFWKFGLGLRFGVRQPN
ncbi:MAG: tetratricopeptide repeat protein [marine benthic group bacterium]|nr:tetratricopeptide repeat protein [Gemmatimonadota bacterium]